MGSTGYRFTITSHVTLNVFSLAVTESTGGMDTSCVLSSMMTSTIPNSYISSHTSPVTRGLHTRRYARSEAGQAKGHTMYLELLLQQTLGSRLYEYIPTIPKTTERSIQRKHV